MPARLGNHDCKNENAASLAYARGVLDAIEREAHVAVVPAAWHLEVAAVLLRRLRARSLTEAAFDRAIRTFNAIPLETHKETPVVGEIVDLAR